MASKNI